MNRAPARLVDRDRPIRHTAGVRQNRLYGSEPVTTRRIRLTADADCFVSASPEAVWQVIVDPRSSLVLDEDVIYAARLPDLPESVGEVRVFLSRSPEGTVATLNEVLTCEPPHRLVMRNMTSREVPMGEETQITGYPDGSSSVSIRVWMELPATFKARLVPINQAKLEAACKKVAERLPRMFSG